MGAVIMAAAMRKEREVLSAFRKAGATSSTHPCTFAALGLDDGMVARRLMSHAVLREVTPGHYYLDEPSWQALEAMRHRMVLVVAVIGLIILVGVLLAGNS